MSTSRPTSQTPSSASSAVQTSVWAQVELDIAMHGFADDVRALADLAELTRGTSGGGR